MLKIAEAEKHLTGSCARLSVIEDELKLPERERHSNNGFGDFYYMVHASYWHHSAQFGKTEGRECGPLRDANAVGKT